MQKASLEQNPAGENLNVARLGHIRHLQAAALADFVIERRGVACARCRVHQIDPVEAALVAKHAARREFLIAGVKFGQIRGFALHVADR